MLIHLLIQQTNTEGQLCSSTRHQVGTGNACCSHCGEGDPEVNEQLKYKNVLGLWEPRGPCSQPGDVSEAFSAKASSELSLEGQAGLSQGFLEIESVSGGWTTACFLGSDLLQDM